jgi:hypothetical protein
MFKQLRVSPKLPMAYALISGLILSLGTPVFAGPVTTDVRICGQTSPYMRYGEAAPGLYGESTTGLHDQFFRILGYGLIEKNTSQPGLPTELAIADFISAFEIHTISICIRGNLETKQRGGVQTYYLRPRLFTITEKPTDILNPSELTGSYSSKQGNLTLSVVPNADSGDSEEGIKFRFAELSGWLSRQHRNNCVPLKDSKVNPSLLSFALTRKTKLTLSGEVSLACDAQGTSDLINVAVEFNKTQTDTTHIVGTMRIERGGVTQTLDLQRNSKR